MPHLSRLFKKLNGADIINFSKLKYQATIIMITKLSTAHIEFYDQLHVLNYYPAAQSYSLVNISPAIGKYDQPSV